MYKSPIAAVLALALLASTGTPAVAAPSASDLKMARDFRKGHVFAALRKGLSGDYDRFVEELIALTEIAAPTFDEGRRGAAFERLLATAGLEDVHHDETGNVYGLRRGKGRGLIVVAAHLDTVFPAGRIKVERDGDTLRAPGVGDDTLGLAVLPLYARILDRANIRTDADILFVATVGEEQLGNLKGARHLVERSRYAGRITGFVGFEPARVEQVIATGVGSRRFDVHFTGPGGHSFSDFGIVNPAYALAGFLRNLSRIAIPAGTRTSFNVGIVSGGTSINAIPADVSALIDIRSDDQKAIATVEAQMRDFIAQAVREENDARSTRQGRIAAGEKLIGDRPAGKTAPDSTIVRLAAASIMAAGKAPAIDAQSTDANAAMAADIPAIVIGPGIEAGGAHSPKEWVKLNRETDIDNMATALTSIILIANAPKP
ncbi:M20/M25/M40 family metallo-hydrolase [Rhizorhabdus histidinilytica]